MTMKPTRRTTVVTPPPESIKMGDDLFTSLLDLGHAECARSLEVGGCDCEDCQVQGPLQMVFQVVTNAAMRSDALAYKPETEQRTILTLSTLADAAACLCVDSRLTGHRFVKSFAEAYTRAVIAKMGGGQ